MANEFKVPDGVSHRLMNSNITDFVVLPPIRVSPCLQQNVAEDNIRGITIVQNEIAEEQLREILEKLKREGKFIRVKEKPSKDD